MGTNSFTVNVINTKAVGDKQPPSFTKKQSITVDATTSNGATVKYELPKVTDNMAIESGPTCTPTSGSFFPIGPTTVKCIATDAAGNQGSTTFVITVKSLIVAPIEIPTNVSISIGKSEYNSKEAIFVKGEATPFTENSVQLNVKDQLNQLVSA